MSVPKSSEGPRDVLVEEAATERLACQALMLRRALRQVRDTAGLLAPEEAGGGHALAPWPYGLGGGDGARTQIVLYLVGGANVGKSEAVRSVLPTTPTFSAPFPSSAAVVVYREEANPAGGKRRLLVDFSERYPHSSEFSEFRDAHLQKYFERRPPGEDWFLIKPGEQAEIERSSTVLKEFFKQVQTFNKDDHTLVQRITVPEPDDPYKLLKLLDIVDLPGFVGDDGHSRVLEVVADAPTPYPHVVVCLLDASDGEPKPSTLKALIEFLERTAAANQSDCPIAVGFLYFKSVGESLPYSDRLTALRQSLRAAFANSVDANGDGDDDATTESHKALMDTLSRAVVLDASATPGGGAGLAVALLQFAAVACIDSYESLLSALTASRGAGSARAPWAAKAALLSSEAREDVDSSPVESWAKELRKQHLEIAGMPGTGASQKSPREVVAGLKERMGWRPDVEDRGIWSAVLEEAEAGVEQAVESLEAYITLRGQRPFLWPFPRTETNPGLDLNKLREARDELMSASDDGPAANWRKALLRWQAAYYLRAHHDGELRRLLREGRDVKVHQLFERDVVDLKAECLHGLDRIGPLSE